MKVLGLIPVRGGSQRLPRKNVRPLGGKPLTAWAVEAALAARSLDRLIVSSDDDELLALARSYDPRIAARRPAELATDTSLVVFTVQHVLRELAASEGLRFDAVAIIQATNPFTSADDIDGTVGLLAASGAETAVTVVETAFGEHPSKFKRLDGDRLIPYYEDERGRTAAHQMPRAYVRNGGVYASRAEVFGRDVCIGNDCRGYVVPRERSVDINDEMDFRFAEFLFHEAAQPTAKHS